MLVCVSVDEKRMVTVLRQGWLLDWELLNGNSPSPTHRGNPAPTILLLQHPPCNQHPQSSIPAKQPASTRLPAPTSIIPPDFSPASLTHPCNHETQ